MVYNVMYDWRCREMECNFKVREEVIETPAGNIHKEYDPPKCAMKHSLRDCDGEAGCIHHGPRDIQVVLKRD